jgi:adenylate cyclase
MTSQDIQRKLTAILYADVVGYSRLTGADEVGTHRLLSSCLDAMTALIEKHRGRVVHYAGDAVLADFGSVVDALTSAVEVQSDIAARNEALPDDHKVQFRIGINLGEVIIDREDIYGDGVNVAARLEGIADPGGICISASVHEQVAGKLELAFENMGDQEVKNIAKPVHAYRVLSNDSRLNAPAASQGASLQEKPSIAVLPFDNMSGDPEQEYFADGITEDIITELSRFKELMVIARNSTFTFKGRAVNVQDVGQELGVRYVVEGSVRKAGNRVRITVQLVDAETSNHIWAERYDRELEDIFALQDEVTQAIVATLPGRVEADNIQRVERKPTEIMAAHDYLIRAKIHHHNGTREDNAIGQEMVGKAIELDPQYAQAYAWKACILGQSFARGYVEMDEVLEEIVASLEKSQSLDDNDYECHRILAAVNVIHNKLDQAKYHQEKAFALKPNYDLIVVQNGELATWLGKPEEGADWVKTAMRLNPYHPERYWSHLGRALYGARRYQEAVEAFKRLAQPDHGQYAFITACYAQLDDDEQARTSADEVLKLAPDFSAETYTGSLPYQDQEDREHLRTGLAKAGLPN